MKHLTFAQWLAIQQSHEYNSPPETPLQHEAERIRAAVAAISGDAPESVLVDEATETVTLANGAIKAVGLPMVRFLADRLTSISLKRTTARLGHTSL